MSVAFTEAGIATIAAKQKKPITVDADATLKI
jgi:hypothetical protein